jgi:hypothetical protein
MTDRAEPDRFNLETEVGIQMLVAALCHLAEYEIRISAGMPSEDAFQDRLDRYREYFSTLRISPEVSEHAQSILIKDFRFSSPELFKYQRLVFFISTDRPKYWPLSERETPIAKNCDLSRSNCLHHLVDEWMIWHSDQETKMPFDPLSSVEYDIFRHFAGKILDPDYLAGDKYGPRIHDGTRDAAREALYLVEGGMSKRAAVKAVLKMKVPFRKDTPETTREFNFSHVVAHSSDAAEKKVKREMKRILEEDH